MSIKLIITENKITPNEISTKILYFFGVIFSIYILTLLPADAEHLAGRYRRSEMTG